MSDILPAPKPVPVPGEFLADFAGELCKMHSERFAHGNLGKYDGSWLDETTRRFDPKKFRDSSDKSVSFTKEEMERDVAGFLGLAKEWISGKKASTEEVFLAKNHLSAGLPVDFLSLLESCTSQESSSLPSLESISLTLTAEATPNAAVPAAPEVPVEAPANPTTQPLPTSIIRIALRNGTVGRAYHVEPGAIAGKIAESRGDDPGLARISHLQLPTDCGLVFQESTGTVTGTPTRALEETLLLDYAPSPSAPSIRFEVSLIINPDPASLWKDLDPPLDAPYQKVSLDHKEFNFPDFRVVAASRRGRSHANKGDFRDDDFAVGYATDTGWLIVAVADGAGSAKYSRKGSDIACSVCRDWLVASLNSPEYRNLGMAKSEEQDAESKPIRPIRDLLYDAARLAHDKIDKEARNPSEPLPEPAAIRNYDTTLILMLVKKIGGSYIVATFSIGDGGAGVMDGAGHARLLTLPDGGEHAGQTVFLTMPSTLSVKPENLEKRYQQEVISGFTGALAMTDGITDPKFPSDAAFADPQCWKSFWTELEPALMNSESLLEWMNFFSPGNHDDRTLVTVLPAANEGLP